MRVSVLYFSYVIIEKCSKSCLLGLAFSNHISEYGKEFERVNVVSGIYSPFFPFRPGLLVVFFICSPLIWLNTIHNWHMMIVDIHQQKLSSNVNRQKLTFFVRVEKSTPLNCKK